jgi:hypothetical protein
MVVSADFEKQHYFLTKNIALSNFCNIALSFYHIIACENRLSDKGLTWSFLNGVIKFVIIRPRDVF